MNLPKVTKALLAGGADVNLRDSAGDTALHYASTCAGADTISVLLAGGANPLRKGADSETALGCALARGDAAIISMLEANIKASDPTADLQRLRSAASQDLERRGTVQAPSAGSGAATGAGPAQQGPVAGYNLVDGVVKKGPMQVKALTGTFKWRDKFFVASSRYNALFYWTGNALSATSVAKMVSCLAFWSRCAPCVCHVVDAPSADSRGSCAEADALHKQKEWPANRYHHHSGPHAGLAGSHC